MSFVSPRTWVAGEVITAAIMNEAVRDNLRYLKGTGQVPTISSGLVIDNTDGDEYFKLPLHTTSECASVLNAESEIAYDGTLHRIKYYNGGSVEKIMDVGDTLDTPTDSASTRPISANWAYDFTHILTSAGDIAFASAAGAWSRLGIGTAGTYLYSNGSVPSWAIGTIPQYAIVMWGQTVSTIPTGFVLCDGNNSTPNLLAKFPEGIATASTNPGASGGAIAKTTVGHFHSKGAAASAGTEFGDGSNGYFTDSKTDSITDIRPPYYDLAFIMKS